MFTTAIWILFITQSFAKDMGPHQRYQNGHDSGSPANYYDRIHLPNPHYKINYFYEQRRTDGDSEIDQIEEEIGKYMHYQLFTTTTTAETVPKIEDVNETFKEITDRSTLETPTVVPETLHQNHEEVTTTLPPMPSAPKLRIPIHQHSPKTIKLSPPVTQRVEMKKVQNTDVAKSHLNHHNLQAHEPTSTHHRHPHHRLHISPTTTSSQAPIEAEAQTKHASTEKHIYLSPTTHAPSFKSRHAHNTKVRPISAPRTVYRGRYKFSWDDVNDMHTSIEPKVSQINENPIPSVPTLSPWYDGYGK